LVIIDKKGEIHTIPLIERGHQIQMMMPIKQQQNKSLQCLFMLRNCHIQNTALIGDGDLLLLDPIRLSLNKLNILAGTEVIVLHSTKFLYQIRNIFAVGSKIYFVDVSGNLYHFNELDKKLTQLGNSGVCKYMQEYAIYKNYLLTIENGSLYKTNLTDGNYVEIKNDYTKNYEFFFADNANLIFVNKNDEVNVVSLIIGQNRENVRDNDVLKLKNTLKINNISKMNAVTYFRNSIIYYDPDTRRIISVNIEDGSSKTMTENFPEINRFINNNDFLACILKDGVIYKLYC